MVAEVVRVGAVDCGTNSIRLLVADVAPDGTITDVVRLMEVVRLGYGVDRTGRIDPEAMERTLVQTHEYAARCTELGVAAVRFVATSASRDASNADEFVDGVRAAFAAFDVTPEVVSGAEEAALSFRGATGDLQAAGIVGPYLVVDLGGGSTEFVRGTEVVEASLSTDVGCVRLTERHLHGDPPTRAEVVAATRDVEAALAAAADAVDFRPVRTLVGLAGTVTTVTAHVLGLGAYDPAAIHLSVTTPDAVRRAALDLLARSRPQRAELGFMHPGRVDVIGAGALIWERVVAAVEAASEDARAGRPLAVVTSEHDILDGIALSVADRERRAETRA
ncbi:MAG: exopolyphosphatase [Actinomycetota bacterium]|nr:exopolyphosphatase [Actinomycetota bacterium]